MRTSPRCRVTSACGGFALPSGLACCSSLFASLAVCISEPRRPIQGIGQSLKNLRGLHGDLPRSSAPKFLHMAVGSRRSDQIGPSKFQLGSTALEPGHLPLKLGPLLVALLFPEPGGALMILRRRFVTVSSIPMRSRRVAHHYGSMRTPTSNSQDDRRRSALVG